ncbi:SAM-dependent methyltransferase [Nocardiopsis dassonvillei]|uniref:HsdM family class I SAM-dependent methyltransferase n=1 Tax=Nocardiopsis dassonvillei TaxID=2014 RepID=UPI0020A2FD11|nr:N-6 DNA methylase [Nocardiopsis dassonvillei]MCP3013135.1 SAM-dependent methyltransferase [Nocardiopsis dassonvillei]
MGAGNDGGGDIARALVGPADIARLAGVRRPAVSNWRRRFDDFPRPVDGTSANPLFALEAVRAWCRQHDKAFETDRTDLLWQRVRTEVPDVRLTAFMAYAGRQLTDLLPVGARPDGVPEEWVDLADEVLAGDDPEPVFEELCARLTRERGRAETSPELAAWMAELAGIGEGSSVLDPACGTGVLLSAALRRGALTVFGQDRDPDALDIATALLVVPRGVSAMAGGDSLRAPAFERSRADAVLCDPPFRDREWGYEELVDDPRWVYGLPPRGEGELAWVQHCLSRVRPGGRAVVLLPSSVAYRPGGRRIRANLLRSGALRAVLEVPGGAEPGRHVWVLVRPEESNTTGHGVLLVASTEASESARVWGDFAAGRPVDPGPYWMVAEVGPLLDEEVDLRPSRLLDSASRSGAVVRYPALLGEFAELLDQVRALSDELELVPDGETPMTTLGALADAGAVELHRAPMAMGTESGEVPVLTVRDVRSGEGPSGRCDRVPGLVMLRYGDVVVAETVRDAPVHVVEEGGAALGPRLLALRPVWGRTDPDFLAGAVGAEAVSSSRTSSGRADVRSLRLPALSLEEQRAYAGVWSRMEQGRELLERVAGLGARLAALGGRGLREGELRPRESGT